MFLRNLREITFRLTNVIPERIIFVSRGITTVAHGCQVSSETSVPTCKATRLQPPPPPPSPKHRCLHSLRQDNLRISQRSFGFPQRSKHQLIPGVITKTLEAYVKVLPQPLTLCGATGSSLCSFSGNDLCRQLQAVSRWGCSGGIWQGIVIFTLSRAWGGGIDVYP